MSIFFEPRPHWGPAAFMHPTPADAEDQSGDDNAERPGPHHGGPHHHRGRGGPHGHRGGPFGMRGGPFHHHGHHGHPGFEHGHGPGPREDESFGPMRWGRGGMFGPRGHHHHPYHGFHHRGHHRGGRGGVRVVPIPLGGPATGFEFLTRFASEMGNGFQDFMTGPREANNDNNKPQVDFEPRADVFDTANEYVIHVSLPGAQKPDISVEYDAQKSTVRIAGVVHRPEFSEELNAAMVWNERRREVGVFERSFKFIPSGSEAVDVDAENITAKMVDGVLIVRLPKTQKEEEVEKQNKKIVINGDEDLYDADPVEKEKDVEHEKHDAEDVTNEKHASVIEVQDEMDSMHLTSDTEAGDLLEEVDQTIYTPSHLSDEDAEEAAEYVKVDVK
ncbi:heat shock protein [Talaromyces pinophilus]|jgi:HSP20 family protein|uniref:Heat shock protein n=1 Tax=Talaromyces pinophilus TaxID=128442 RepID=A0A478EBN6_TALPI|nr:heat shock protein [Talaromyces pinophilus]